MQTAETESRAVIKSFRTTKTLTNELKEFISAQSERKVSESDIINTAVSEYLNNFNNNKESGSINQRSKKISDFYYQKATEYINMINNQEPIKIRTPKQAADYLKNLIPKNKEAVYVLYLDPHNFLIKTQLLGIGKQYSISFDYSNMIKTALSLNPCHIVIAHNHPGEGNAPSAADIITTKKIYITCQYSTVAIADALILDDYNNHYSFVDGGYFKKFEREFNRQIKILNKEK